MSSLLWLLKCRRGRFRNIFLLGWHVGCSTIKNHFKRPNVNYLIKSLFHYRTYLSKKNWFTGYIKNYLILYFDCCSAATKSIVSLFWRLGWSSLSKRFPLKVWFSFHATIGVRFIILKVDYNTQIACLVTRTINITIYKLVPRKFCIIYLIAC